MWFAVLEKVLPCMTAGHCTAWMPYDPERHGPERIVGPGFHEKVFDVVLTIPHGHVTTYGDVAAALGMRSVARKVGHALAALPPDREDVPWHRVVNAQGRISRPIESSSGKAQRDRLGAEGIEVDDTGRVLGFRHLRVPLAT
jgi:methylated-DNA-protein-cysteine methyltransferase related protein